MSAVEREEIAFVGDPFEVDVDAELENSPMEEGLLLEDEGLLGEEDGLREEGLRDEECLREGFRGEPREKRDPFEDACVDAEKMDGRVFEEVGYVGLVGLPGSDGPAVRRDALLGVLGEEARFVLMLLGAPRRGPESTDLLRRSLRGESSLESPETKRAPEPRLPSSSFGVG